MNVELKNPKAWLEYSKESLTSRLDQEEDRFICPGSKIEALN